MPGPFPVGVGRRHTYPPEQGIALVPLSLDAMLVQPSNSGGFVGASGSATLPTGTTAGSTLLLLVSSTTSGNVTASGFTDSAPTNIGSTKAFALHKANVAAAEMSWTITSGTGAINRWTIYEIAGIDPDAPVDVKQTGTTPSITSGTTAATGNVGPSTTYDGLVVAIHAARHTASTTAPTFSGHTGGMTEMDEGGANDGTGSVGLSVSMQTTQSLGTFASTATGSITFTGSNAATALIVVYSAQDAKRAANVAHFWSFPAELAGAAGLNLGVAFSRYWETQTGSPVITADGLQLTGTASIQNVVGPNISISTIPGPAHLARVRFRLDSLSGDLELAALLDGGAKNTVVRYVAASSKIGVKVGAGSEVLSDATVTTGQFYNLDIRTRGTLTSRTTDWQLDYGSGPVAQAQATDSFAGPNALGNLTQPRLGWAASATGTVTYDDALYSVVAGHYPLGDFTFVFCKPDPAATPTVSGTVGNFALITNNATGAALTTPTLSSARDAVDDWPPTVGASADGFCATAASATDYLELPMATYQAAPTGSVRAVRPLLCMWAAAATTATCRVLGYDGTTATTLFSEADPGTDNSSTPAWICAMWKPSGGWTQAKLDAAAIRFGSNDATPDIGPHAVGMEVAVQAAAVGSIIGEAGSVEVTEARDALSGAMLGVTTTTPAEQGTTLFWDDAGTPGSQVVAAASSHTETFDAPDATTVAEVGVISDNEAPERG
jgi:hypothetical protein